MLPFQIEKSAYKAGINVHLERAEKNKVYKLFRSTLEDFLYKQIRKIANSADIDNLMLLTKVSAPVSLVLQISVLLGSTTAANSIDMESFLYWAGTQGGKAALDKMNLKGSFYLENKEVTQYFDDYARLRLESVDNTTKEWIAQQIQNGKERGLSPAQIATQMRDDGFEYSQMRAERIVVTETAYAMTYVEIEAASRYGVQEKIWRTSKDDRVDPLCLELEGQKVGIKAVFAYGFDGPPAHPSCRCFLEEVIPDTWVIPETVWLGE